MAHGEWISLGFPEQMAGNGVPAFTNQTMFSSTDQVEVIFSAIDSVAITKLGVRLAAISGTTPTYKISLQGVDGSGNPDGTIKGGGSPASKTFNPSSLGWAASSWHWITLDNSYTPSRGEVLAFVIAYDSGTIDVSNFATFTNTIGSGLVFNGFHYAIQNVSGSRTRQNGCPVYGYASASRAYGRPILAINTHTFNSGSATDEYALAFQLPTGWGSTLQVAGARFEAALSAASSVIVQSYNGTSVLDTITRDSDLARNTGIALHEFWFTSLATLNFGSTYRVGFQPQTATNMSVYSFDVDAASDWDAWPGGQKFWTSTRVDGGAWTDVLTRRLLAAITLADITASSGTGPFAFSEDGSFLLLDQ